MVAAAIAEREVSFASVSVKSLARLGGCVIVFMMRLMRWGVGSLNI